MKLKVNHGNKNRVFEYGLDSTITIFKKLIHFKHLKVLMFFWKTIFYFNKVVTNKRMKTN